MNKYMSITVIYYRYSLPTARIHYYDEEAGIQLHYSADYEEGMRQLRKLEKLLNRPAKLVVNQFDRNIAYKELYGFLDRE